MAEQVPFQHTPRNQEQGFQRQQQDCLKPQEQHGSWGQQLGRWAETIEGCKGRTQQAFQLGAQRLQESTAKVGQVLQDSTVASCVSCRQRVLRTNAQACQECGFAYCQTCSETFHIFSTADVSGLIGPGLCVEVCRVCGPGVQKRCQEQNVKERMKRVAAFLDGCLEPYLYAPESKLDLSLRLGTQMLEGGRVASMAMPLEAYATANVGYYLVRNGPLVLMGGDVVKILQLLMGLVSKLDTEMLQRASLKHLFGGLYYMMGENIGMRGKSPQMEAQQHMDASGKIPSPSRETLLQLRRMCRLLFAVTYMDDWTPADAQRLLKQVLPGGELVLAELSHLPEVPSYFLACTPMEKKAYLLVPGTRVLPDVVTDFNAEPEQFMEGSAHRGMTRSAKWLYAEVGPLLVHLHSQGFSITVVGHSLGAAVAGLFSHMLRLQLGAALQCFGFGVPACVDHTLRDAMKGSMISVVHRDDLVPRLTVRSIEQLASVALSPAQVEKTTTWWAEDLQSLQDVERIVELRRRSVLEGGSSDDRPLEEKFRLLCDAGVERQLAERVLREERGDLTRALLRATKEEVEGADEAENPLVPGPQGRSLNPLASAVEYPGSPSRAQGPMASGGKAYPHFFIPGQIVHLFSQDGLAMAASSRSASEPLLRIFPMQNMVEDHLLRSYDEALRQACLHPRPTKKRRWETFDERRICACCQSDFNWAYVLQSEPQHNLARHHCRQCGRLVCDGCSKHRKAHPLLGFEQPVRTCDTCFFSDGL